MGLGGSSLLSAAVRVPSLAGLAGSSFLVQEKLFYRQIKWLFFVIVLHLNSKLSVKNSFLVNELPRNSELFVLTFLIAMLTGCLHRSNNVPNHQDEILFNRAMLAVQERKFDVAHLTFQTLINTYPKSKCARRAEKVMRDPQIGGCGQAWSTPHVSTIH